MPASDQPIDRSSRRGPGEAALQALPDLLAAAGCGLAWVAPAAPGFDLLSVFGPFFAVELAVAIVLSMAGVRRIADQAMARRIKAEMIALPALALAVFAGAYLGAGALLALLWLGGRTLWMLARETQDRRPAVSGLWIVYTRGADRQTMELTRTPPSGPLPAGTWVVAAGQEQKMAGITIGLWMLTVVGVYFVGAIPELGATAAYAAAVGWDASRFGADVPAHTALAAGSVLFGLRAIAHFHHATGLPRRAR